MKHRKPVEIEEREPTRGAKVINLVEALKRSVGENERAHMQRDARRKAR
jgi:non-homologous end joining protein Ku